MHPVLGVFLRFRDNLPMFNEYLEALAEILSLFIGLYK